MLGALEWSPAWSAVPAHFGLSLHIYVSVSMAVSASFSLCPSIPFSVSGPVITSLSLLFLFFLILHPSPSFSFCLYFCLLSLCFSASKVFVPYPLTFFPEYVALLFCLTGSSVHSVPFFPTWHLFTACYTTGFACSRVISRNPAFHLFSLVYSCPFDSQVFLGLAWEPSSLPSSSTACESPSPSCSLCLQPSVLLSLVCSHPHLFALALSSRPFSLPGRLKVLPLSLSTCPVGCLFLFSPVWSLQALCCSSHNLWCLFLSDLAHTPPSRHLRHSFLSFPCLSASFSSSIFILFHLLTLWVSYLSASFL